MLSPRDELKELKHKSVVLRYMEGLILDKKMITIKWVSWFCSLSLDASILLLEEFALRDGLRRPDVDIVYAVVGELLTGQYVCSIVLGEELEETVSKFKEPCEKYLFSVVKKNLFKKPCFFTDTEHKLDIPEDDYSSWPIAAAYREQQQSEKVMQSLEQGMLQFYISDKINGSNKEALIGKEEGCKDEPEKGKEVESKKENDESVKKENDESKKKEDESKKGKTEKKEEKKKTAVCPMEMNTEERKRIAQDFFKRPAKYARTDKVQVPGKCDSELEDEAGMSAVQGSQEGVPDKEMNEAGDVLAALTSQPDKCESADVGGSSSKEDLSGKGCCPMFSKSTNKSNRSKVSKKHGKRSNKKAPLKKMKRIINIPQSESDTSSSCEGSDEEMDSSPNFHAAPIESTDVMMDSEECDQSSVPIDNHESSDGKAYTMTLTSETHDAEDGFIVTKKVISKEEIKPDSKAEDKPNKASADDKPKKPFNRPDPKKSNLKLKQSSLTDFFKK